MTHPALWAAVGFGVGLFWLALALAFFSGGPSLFVGILCNGIAVATCPPLGLGFNYFAAPFANAVFYGGIAALGVRYAESGRGERHSYGVPPNERGDGDPRPSPVPERLRLQSPGCGDLRHWWPPRGRDD